MAKRHRLGLYIDDVDKEGIEKIKGEMKKSFGTGNMSSAVRLAIRSRAFGDESMPPISRHTRRSPKED